MDRKTAFYYLFHGDAWKESSRRSISRLPLIIRQRSPRRDSRTGVLFLWWIRTSYKDWVFPPSPRNGKVGTIEDSMREIAPFKRLGHEIDSNFAWEQLWNTITYKTRNMFVGKCSTPMNQLTFWIALANTSHDRLRASPNIEETKPSNTPDTIHETKAQNMRCYVCLISVSINQALTSDRLGSKRNINWVPHGFCQAWKAVTKAITHAGSDRNNGKRDIALWAMIKVWTLIHGFWSTVWCWGRLSPPGVCKIGGRSRRQGWIGIFAGVYLAKGLKSEKNTLEQYTEAL